LNLYRLHRPSWRLTVVLVASILFILPARIASARGAKRMSAPVAAPPRFLQAKTLARAEDPVIVVGKDLPGMIQRPTTNLRAYAMRGEVMTPIPFQVDEFDKHGVIVSPEGEHPEKDEDGGKLDENDQVVVMASDLGDRAPRNLYPCGARAASEIEVTDPESGRKGWFYVFDFDDPPPRSPISYVHYDPVKDSAETPLYLIDFNEHKSILLDDLRAKSASGDLGPNLIDRIKVRMVFKTRAFLTFKFNEEDIVSHVTAYKNGPIRAVRTTEYYLRRFFIKLTPTAHVDYLFYRNAVEGPSELKVPFSPKLLLRNGSRAVSGLHFDDAVYGWKFCSAKNPTCTTLDGSTGRGNHLIKDDVDWFAIYGNGRGTMSKVVYGSSLLDAKLRYILYYLDDKKREDPPERVKGGAMLGFVVNLMKIPRGQHKLWFYQYFKAPFEPGDIARFNAILDHPLAVKALAVSLPNGGGRASAKLHR
jgi:hypothetical protein